MGTRFIRLSWRRSARTAAAGASVLAAAGLLVAAGRAPAQATTAAAGTASSAAAATGAPHFPAAPAAAAALAASTWHPAPSPNVALAPGNGPFRVVSAESGLCLTAGHSGEDAVGNPCGKAEPANSWTINQFGQLKAKGRCLATADGGTANGTHVVTVPCQLAGTHLWRVSKGQLVNRGSSRCLDVTDHGSAPGTVLQIWDCSGGKNQSWWAAK